MATLRVGAGLTFDGINGNVEFIGIVTAARISPKGTNIRFGDATTGCSITSGAHNFFAGVGAGQSTTTGNYNNFFGMCAGFSNTTGNDNNFTGRFAGCSNTTGSNNTFFGRRAGQYNTTGGYNNFFGRLAGYANTSGSNNNFLGRYAGCSNTTGTNNNFLGRCAGFANISGCYNNFFGVSAGCSNTTGNSNNFFGFQAGRDNTTGTDNFFVGYNAGRLNTTGCYNNFFGVNAGFANTTGVANNFFGREAGCANTTGSYNNFLGWNVGRSNTTGSSNIFIGLRSGCLNTTGGYNVFFGANSGCNNTTGGCNFFGGYNAGRTNTTGCYNNFFGRNAGLANTTGSDNNFIGRNAGCVNTTGSFNNFVGSSAGRCNTTAGCNSFFGTSAGSNSSTGDSNSFFGYYAGGKNSTGACNTFLGRYAGCSNTTGSHNVAIGNNAQLPSATGSCQLVIGSAGVNWIYGDSSARVLLGTSTSNSSFDSRIQIAGNGLGGTQLISRFDANNGGPVLWFAKSRSATVGTNTIVQSGDTLGAIGFYGADGTSYINGGGINGEVDGTPGTNDVPSRLVFRTLSASGGGVPTERARITSSGYLKVTNSGTYQDSASSRHDLETNSATDANLFLNATSTSYGSAGLVVRCARSATTAYNLGQFQSAAGNDNEFILRGDGNAYADGSWNGGGADYAEYFEWSDANPNEEDRRGISVVLDGDKIREATAGEEPIGVISGNPSIVGDAAWNKWSGKYLRDEFGTYILENYEVEDEDGNTVVQQRRKMNPAYDPDQEYISREQRPEWDCVGLMGKLRIRKGQVTGARWIKMRNVSTNVEEWLVR